MGGRSKAWVSLDRWQRIWKLHYKQGWGQRQIAKSMRISHTTVQHYLKKGPPPGWKPDKRPDAEVVPIARKRGRAPAAGGGARA
jgi:hypothetical protein